MYLCDEKDQYMRPYGHRDCRLSEVIRDMYVKEGDNTYPIASKWVHTSVSIVAGIGVMIIHPSLEDVMVVDQEEEEEDQDNEDVKPLPYLSCAACGMKTDMKSLMNTGLLISFSKFLELLIYCLPPPMICSCPGLAKIWYDFQGKGKESDASHGESSFSSKEKAEVENNLRKVELQQEISAWWEDIGKRSGLLEADEAQCLDEEYKHG
ncbi:hypothetical protein F5146DRAFT_1000310 [Armillaria mellea]|nr:hypothetical protein F5146DRAFT_1000310 [Armillaria mellea]